MIQLPLNLPTLNFEISISLILFLSLVGYFISKKLKVSLIIGEIIVGLIVGPSMLGLLSYSGLVKEFAKMGVIFLMFVIGLHTTFKEIFTPRALMIAAGGVVLPWIGGFVISLLFFGNNFLQGFYFGTVLTATSVAVSAQVLTELGKLKTIVGNTIIGASVADDVLCLIFLEVTRQATVEGSINALGVLKTVGIAVAFIVFAATIGRKLVAKFIEKLRKLDLQKGSSYVSFIGATFLAFAYGMTAEFVGLSAVVGAFIAGVTLEERFARGGNYLEAVFAGAFFLAMGLLVTNLSFVLSIPFLLFTGALILVGMLTKVVGSYIPSRFLGLTRHESLTVGLGRMARGEIALVTALFGISYGIINQSQYVSILLLCIVSTILTPLILGVVLRNSKQ